MNNMLANAIVKNSASGNSASGIECRVSDNNASDTGRGQDVASQPGGQNDAGQNSDSQIHGDQIAIPSISGSLICVEGQWIPISASGSDTGIQPDVMMSVYLSGSAPAARKTGQKQHAAYALKICEKLCYL